MKKCILTTAAVLAFVGMQAQIQTNNGTQTGITNSNVLIDGSSAFSTESGAQPYVGKGIVIPSVDLVNFQFDLTLADGFTFPTYFDGMIVYNKATGNTLTTGNRPSASLAVTPGFYYFSNPNGATNGNVTGGTWKALGGGAASAGDNLGNHSATQNLALNSFELRLKGASDNNQSLVYNATVDGPRLFGANGGYLGTSNGTNALTWDSGGNITSASTVNAGKKVILNPGLSTETGYISLIKPDNTKLGDIGGFSDNDLHFQSFTGKSIFHSRVDVGVGNIGKISINTPTTDAGYISILKPNNTKIGDIGGWSDTDLHFQSPAGKSVFHARLDVGTGAGVGKLNLITSTSAAGYISIIRPDDTKVGDIGGWNDTDLHFQSPAGKSVFHSRLDVGTGTGVGKLNFNTTNSAAGFISIIRLDDTKVGDIGGWNDADLHFQSPAGKSVFHSRLDVGYGGGVGRLNLNTTNSAAGYISIIRPDNTNLADIGGFTDNDFHIQTFAGKTVFHTGVNMGYGAVGKISFDTPTTDAGYMTIKKPDNTIVGYVGGFSDNHLHYQSPAGYHYFHNTIVAPRVQGPSDRRFKKDITRIGNATEKLNQLNGYTYTWRDKKDFPGQALGEGKDMGVIAQEVEKVFPDVVQTNEKGYKSVNYNALIPVLIEALKESNQRIKSLEDRLNSSRKISTTQEQAAFSEMKATPAPANP